VVGSPVTADGIGMKRSSGKVYGLVVAIVISAASISGRAELTYSENGSYENFDGDICVYLADGSYEMTIPDGWHQQFGTGNYIRSGDWVEVLPHKVTTYSGREDWARATFDLKTGVFSHYQVDAPECTDSSCGEDVLRNLNPESIRVKKIISGESPKNICS
jgi:hypothetical protein